MRERLARFRPGEIRRRWAEFARLRRALFDEGGAAIESPGDTHGRPGALDARTVVQPDGDVLWFVDEVIARDARALRAHAESVARWYEESGRTTAALRAQLNILRAAASGLAAALVALASPVDLWSLWTPAVALVAQPLVQEVTGRVLRRGMAALLT